MKQLTDTMFKAKIYNLKTYRKTYGDSSIVVCDLLYCFYVFGILINAVNVNQVPFEKIADIFGNKEII